MSKARDNPTPDPESTYAKSVSEALRGRFGSDVDPQITLGSVEDVTEDVISSELLRKLAIHTSGRYEIKGEVGRGGMGLVLKVWDQNLRRPLAMKVILGKDESGSGAPSADVEQGKLTRFLEEAQITGQLDHPGIVPVHELGLDTEGRTFFTMRLVKGRDLKSLFERKEKDKETWPVARSLGVFIKICETMAYAHSKGVVHRDLKPANIMIGRFGETYVMDWGLAKVIEHGPPPTPDSSAELSMIDTGRRAADGESATPHGLTMDGDVMGTPSYMPPEQARGQAEFIGPWSDIYAVGAMLYQLLSGRPPYVTPGTRTSPHSLLAMLLHGPPTPISEIDPHVAQELVSICDKAMARDVGERYQDMMQMGEDIQAYLDGRVVQAHNTSAIKAFAKLIRRNKGLAGAVAALIVLGVAASLAFIWQQNQTIKAVQEEQRRTVDARDAAVASEQLATRQTYVANLIAADVSLRANEIQAAKHRLEECPEELRGWEWRHLQLKTDTSLAVLPHQDVVTCVAFARDGSRMATGARDAVVRVWDPRTQALLLELREHDGTINALAFSPDGTQLASASEDEFVRVWDVASGSMLLTLTGHDGAVTAVAYSPDGSELASGSTDETIRIWNASSGATAATLTGHEGSLTGVVFTPDGRLIVSAAEDGSVRLWDAEARDSQSETLFERETKIAGLAVSPDGSLIAFAGNDAGIRVWSLADRTEAFVLAGHSAPVTSIAFTSAGRQLVSASLDETVRIWDVKLQGPVGVLRGHDDVVLSVDTAADGARILTSGADATARLWNPAVCESFLALDCGASHAASVATCPDGARLVAGSDHPRGVTIWDAASGAVLLSLPGIQGDRVTTVAFSPDGSWIVTGGFQDPSLYVLDSRTGAVLLGPLTDHLSSITSVAVSPDGSRIVSGSDDGTACVWDAASGKRLAKLEDDGLSILSVAIAPDGSVVATGSMDGTIRLWSPDGVIEAVLEGHADGVSTLAFEAASGRLVSGSDDETVRIWDVGGEREPVVLTGHTGPVVSVALSPDGSRILSGSHDATLRIWSSESGESLLTLRGHELPVTSVAFGKGGERIFSASFDRTLRVWETNSARARSSAQEAGRAVLGLLEELGGSEGGPQVLERARERLRADSRLDENVRAEATRLLDLMGGH